MAFNDNSIVLLDPTDQQVQSTIYPPPTPAEVTRVFYCTSIQRMFLLLKTGSICVYKVDKDPKPDAHVCPHSTGKDQEKFSQTGTLERLQESKSLKDYEGKSMSQSICSINKCYTAPPQYDCEIFSDLYKYREPSHPDYEFIQDPDGEDLDRFLVIGLSKGSIIFVKVNNLDQIYARFSIHREEVKQIYEIRKDRVFLSICEENILCIWGFTEVREQLYHKFNLYREVMSIIVAKSQQLLVCFMKGDSEILVWNNETEQLCELQEKDKSDEHEDIITCCDSMQIDNLPEKTLFVTGDEQGLVKIWNSMKVLIREIKFVEPVNSVAFLNEKADLIVGHSGNLSRLYAVDYMDKSAIVPAEAFEEYMASEKAVDEKWFKKISQKGGSEEVPKAQSGCCGH